VSAIVATVAIAAVAAAMTLFLIMAFSFQHRLPQALGFVGDEYAGGASS
jgi:hypothetical protein